MSWGSRDPWLVDNMWRLWGAEQQEDDDVDTAEGSANDTRKTAQRADARRVRTYTCSQ